MPSGAPTHLSPPWVVNNAGDDMVSSDVEDINVSEIQEAVLDSIRESFNGK